MNPIILQIIKWAIEKAILEAGKQVDWAKLKTDLDIKLDSMIPSGIYDRVAKYLVGLLIDTVSSYFVNSTVPLTPEVIRQAVDHASQTLLGKVAAEFLKV